MATTIINNPLTTAAAIITRLLPRFCCVCDSLSDLAQLDLCKTCYHNLPWRKYACYQCGEKLKFEHEHIYCDDCQVDPPAFDRTITLFTYEEPIRKFIAALKFEKQLYYAALFGKLLATELAAKYNATNMPEVFIPMPLDPTREKARGYNQALELTKQIKRFYAAPDNFHINHNLITKVKHLQPQSELSAKARKYNIKPNAFSVSSHNLHSLQQYQHVAIIDDVMTTGATLNAVSTKLKQYGIAYIDVITVARA